MSSLEAKMEEKFLESYEILQSELSSLSYEDISSDNYPEFNETDPREYKSSPLHFQPTDGSNGGINKSSEFPVEELDVRMMAAEIGHWLASEISPSLKLKYGSVNEFYDRVCQRVVVDERREELEIYSLDTSGQPIESDLKPVEARERLKSMATDVCFIDRNPGFLETWETMKHFAGYKAADLNWQEAASDQMLFQTPQQRNYSKYGVGDQELEFVNKIFDFGSDNTGSV